MKTIELPMLTIEQYFRNRNIFPSSLEIEAIANKIGSDVDTLYQKEQIEPHYDGYKNMLSKKLTMINFSLVNCDMNNGITYIGWDINERGFNGVDEMPYIFVIQMPVGDGAQFDNNLRVESTLKDFIMEYDVTAIYRIPLEDMGKYNFLKKD